jgi:phage terminase large subunit-like protein
VTGQRFIFDKATAEAAVAFFPRFIRHVKGEWYGKPVHLSAFQAHDIGQIFGWKRRDGTRRFRRARIWEPRKQGKTLLAAGLGHLLTFGDGEPGAEVYSHATDEKQARICWQMGADMVSLNPELRDVLEVTKEGMLCPGLMSAWLPMSGEVKGKHGYNAHGLIGDEVHEWPTGRVHKFLQDSMSTRRQPLDITISTAGLRDTYGWELYQESCRIRDGLSR